MPAGLLYFGMTLQGQGLCSWTIVHPTPPHPPFCPHADLLESSLKPAKWALGSKAGSIGLKLKAVFLAGFILFSFYFL